MTKETLRNHLADILTDDAPLPREQALDAYTDALWGSFQDELREVYREIISKIETTKVTEDELRHSRGEIYGLKKQYNDAKDGDIKHIKALAQSQGIDISDKK